MRHCKWLYDLCILALALFSLIYLFIYIYLFVYLFILIIFAFSIIFFHHMQHMFISYVQKKNALNKLHHLILPFLPSNSIHMQYNLGRVQT